LIDDAQMAQMIGKAPRPASTGRCFSGRPALRPVRAAADRCAPEHAPARAADLARRLRARIFVSVCTLAFAVCACAAPPCSRECAFSPPPSRTLLMVPLMTTLAFASVYAGMLLATFLFPNGLFAAIVGWPRPWRW